MNGPMPRSLQVITWFKVTDSSGRILRSEELPVGVDLPDRLRLAHRNYQLQGWTVDFLRPRRWSFIAEKAGHRILIGIRPPFADGPHAATGVDRAAARIGPLRTDVCAVFETAAAPRADGNSTTAIAGQEIRTGTYDDASTSDS